MPFERSDDARREDSLYDRLSQVRKNNRELEQQIKELKSELEGKEDSAHFVITDLQTKITELEAERVKLKKTMEVAKEEIKAIGKELTKLQTSHDNALEQIWNKLKLVKIHFC